MTRDDDTSGPLAHPSGLEHLVAHRRHVQPVFNPFYSRMIRWMRLALPLAALAIAAVVFTWSTPRETFLTQEEPGKINKTIGKNELINPRFENTDENNQPYTLTAKRAVQDDQDGKLVILEKPTGDLMLSNGHWVAIEATEGAFQQDQRKLLLRGNVRLFHDGGYQLETPELHINIQDSSAISEKDVYAQGPEGTLEAKGLEGHNNEGVLIFKGPAKLVLNTESSGGLLQ